jgi:hypothetical protein
MKLDFTINTYEQLLKIIREQGFQPLPFKDYFGNPSPPAKFIILRHDVDERPGNALRMAKIEHEMGICATYYFRIVKISNNPSIIRQIAALGHEIGYHYEDFSACHGDMKEAIEMFRKHLEYFRTFYPVKTVCMHGSSMSGYDNRELWKKYSLSDFGLIGEPYLSVDYSKVFYLTDTGRCWDGGKYSVRDFVDIRYDISFHSSKNIMEGAITNRLPDRVILQSHTLWTNSVFEWLWLEFRETIRNNLKMWIVRHPTIRKVSYRVVQWYSN